MPLFSKSPTTITSNSSGITYIVGDENTNNSIRLIDDNGTPVFQKRINGVWNDSDLRVSGDSLHIGRDLSISAAGHHMVVSSKSGSGKFLLIPAPFSDSGTNEPEMPILNVKETRIITQSDDTNEVTGTSFGYIVTPSESQIISRLYYQTGSIPATKDIVLRAYFGTDNTGIMYLQKVIPISEWIANTEIQIDIPGFLNYIDGVSIYGELSSTEQFSIITNIEQAQPWRAVDRWVMTHERISYAPAWSEKTWNKDEWCINNGKIYVCNQTGSQTGSFITNNIKWDLLSDLIAKVLNYKGAISVSSFNALTNGAIGDQYKLSDSGTLVGSIAVNANDTVIIKTNFTGRTILVSDYDHFAESSDVVLQTGRAGGQQIAGGIANGENLVLKSTEDAVKGKIITDDDLEPSQTNTKLLGSLLKVFLNIFTRKIESDDAILIKSASNKAINITSGSAGAINISSEGTGAINIGTDAHAKPVTIGNNTTTTAVHIISGTGNVNITGTGNVGINTSDLDGAPAVGKVTIKGTTNDGTSNIIVCRDSDETNVFTVDTDGKVTAKELLINGSGTITGDLDVQGTISYVNVENLNVESKNIYLLNTDVPTDILADGGGLILNGDTDKAILWNQSTGNWEINTGLTVDNKIQSVAGKSLILDGISTSIDMKVAGTTKATLTNTGLGIGITVPQYLLDVNGAIKGNNFILDSTAYFQMQLFEGEVSDPVMAFDTYDYLRYSRENNKLYYVSGGGDPKFLIDSSGNIGIGISNPTAKLEVKATTNNGSTNVFEGKDSDNTTIFSVDTNGKLTTKEVYVNTVVTSDGTNGYVTINSGSVDRTGFFEWKTGNGTRLGYMGDGSDSVILAMDNGAHLKISGYTKLGSDAPAIKQKKFTFTAASQGNSVNVTTGLTFSKILGFDMLIVTGSGNKVPPSFGDTGTESCYRAYVASSGDVNVTTPTGATGIAGGAGTVLVTYEE